MSGDVDINEFVIGFLLGLGKLDRDDVLKIRVCLLIIVIGSRA